MDLIPQEFKKIEFKKNGLGSMRALRIECPVCHAPPGYACSISKTSVPMVLRNTIFHYKRTLLSPTSMGPCDCIKNILNHPKKKLYVPRDKERGRGRGVHEEGWISGNCTRLLHSQCFSLKCSCRCHKEKD